jgi:flagellin
LTSSNPFAITSASSGNSKLATLGFSSGTFGGSPNSLSVDKIDVTTTSGAMTAIASLDAAIKQISLQQAKSGAYQNRLDTVVNNLTESNQNINASRSRILDTDYANETTNLAKSQIISQAATAMLAQANQSGQSVLALLK